ncbi:MAG: hypothetical protein QOD75_3310 [Blastocatellia bacterium]|nr:hypothetical protein [Blastocatellia bacterium]
MLKLVVEIHNTQVMIPLVTVALWVLNLDDKLKHVGHDELSLLLPYRAYNPMMRSIPRLQTLQKWSVRENIMQSTSGR